MLYTCCIQYCIKKQIVYEKYSFKFNDDSVWCMFVYLAVTLRKTREINHKIHSQQSKITQIIIFISQHKQQFLQVAMIHTMYIKYKQSCTHIFNIDCQPTKSESLRTPPLKVCYTYAFRLKTPRAFRFICTCFYFTQGINKLR